MILRPFFLREVDVTKWELHLLAHFERNQHCGEERTSSNAASTTVYLLSQSQRFYGSVSETGKRLDKSKEASKDTPEEQSEDDTEEITGQILEPFTEGMNEDEGATSRSSKKSDEHCRSEEKILADDRWADQKI